MDLGHAAKSLAFGVPVLLRGKGVPRVRAGDERLALKRLDAPRGLLVSSPAFPNAAPIPPEHAALTGNRSPALAWANVPEAARSLAILAEDPDAPTMRPFVHWLVYNLDPSLRALPAGVRFPLEGRNSNLKPGYLGPMPPEGDEAHRYHFQLLALDRVLPLSGVCGRSAFLRAARGHVIASGELVGTFQR